MSEEIKDLITQLLLKDPNERLGTSDGVKSILKHPWFADMNIKKLLSKVIDPPFIPIINEE